MSTGPATIAVAPRFAHPPDRRSRVFEPLRGRALRILSFAALALYGTARWATLLRPAPNGRLLGLLALAVVTAALVPLLRRVGPPPAVVAALVLALLALPIAGLPWADFVHLRVAVAAREIGDGLSALPASYVPYSGAAHPLRLVVTLGAAVLLMDAAIVLAFAPRELGDARRAVVALPLLVLAVVPSTLLRPEFPYLQGFLLFVLLVFFLWGERTRRRGVAPALLLLAAAGLAGGLLAPRVDQHRPWLDYRAWAGTVSRSEIDAFNWNQTYGPLRWPHTGHAVFTVSALHGDYWKAEDLDVFDGSAWVAGRVASALPAPDPAALQRWSQTIRVYVTGLRSSDVIGAGESDQPAPLPGGAIPGDGPGTWVTDPPLAPGTTYAVTTYSPHPGAAVLSRDGAGYPNSALAPYRTLTLPLVASAAHRLSAVQFAAFPSRGASVPGAGERAVPVAAELQGSVYAPVYGLARRLAAHASTPYGYAMAVMRFLAHGYRYSEHPRAQPYPLVSFLFKDRLGYCQQFSGAMALLLRMGGVPARVAAGFTPGSLGPSEHWVVSDLDAHAWVEAWFPRYGWVRFDPTPLSAPARGGAGNSAAIIKDLSHRGGGSPPAAQHAPLFPSGGTHAARHVSGGGTSAWLLAGASLVGLVIVALGIGLLRPEPGPAERLRELERALARTHQPVGPDVTLAALERRLAHAPAAAGYIRALRLARYADAAAEPDRGARRALRTQLRRGGGVWGRLRALWALPPRLESGRGRRARDLD